MKKVIIGSFVVVAMLALMVGPAMATKPGAPGDPPVNPNGFPSGFHYNLNIIGKNPSFDVDTDCSNEPEELNVIYIPEVTDENCPIEIYMKSGRKGSPKTAGLTAFQVTDWCAGWCSGADENGSATIEIPPDPVGYYVYARALGKLTDNPSILITPGIVSVEDEDGNDLVYLGLVTKNGVFTSAGVTVTRLKGKANKAIPITDLFMFEGTICYFDSNDCEGGCDSTQTVCCIDVDSDSVYDSCCFDEDATPDGYYETCYPTMCCADTDEPKDGTYDMHCFDVNDDGDYVDDMDYCYPGGAVPEDCEEEGECGCADVTVHCKDYSEDPEWIFNIADLVTYLWDVDNQGLKLLQVRFYPASEMSE
jgi:hypothetical protein